MLKNLKTTNHTATKVLPTLSRCLATSVVALALLGTTALPAGASGSKLKDSKFGFSFSLPKGWVQIPLTSKDISGMMDLLTKDDPSMKASITRQIQNAGEEGIKDMAFGPISNQLAANVNVVVEPASGSSSGSAYFDEAGVEAKIGLSTVGMTRIRTSTVKLPIGKELQVTYDLPRKVAPTGGRGLQLYLRHKTHLFIVTFTSSTISVDESAAHAAGQSWRWSTPK